MHADKSKEIDTGLIAVTGMLVLRNVVVFDLSSRLTTTHGHDGESPPIPPGVKLYITPRLSSNAQACK